MEMMRSRKVGCAAGALNCSYCRITSRADEDLLVILLLCYQAAWKVNQRLYLVPGGLDVQASLGERRLHADEESSVGRLVGGGVRTGRGWKEEEEEM